VQRFFSHPNPPMKIFEIFPKKIALNLPACSRCQRQGRDERFNHF
jgi:hypothetical protein